MSGDGEEQQKRDNILAGYDGRSEIMRAPSFSESTRWPVTQGGASSPIIGDSRPLFIFFSFFGRGVCVCILAGPAIPSASNTVFLLGMQPILFIFVSGTGKQAAHSVRTHEEERLGGGVRKRRDGERAGRADI